MNNNLTPQLQESQLKENIDFLVKQGLERDKIQSYVDNYIKSADGSYILKTTQNTNNPLLHTYNQSTNVSGSDNGFLKSVPIGIAKGELSTIKGLGTIGQTFLDQTAGRVVNAVQGKGFTPTGATGGISDIYHKGTDLEKKASESLQPKNLGESVGFTGEKIAEFFIPTKFVTGATKAISAAHMPPLLESVARVGLNTLAPTAVSYVQQGELNKEVGKTAGYSAAFSSLSEGIRVLSKTPAGQKFVSWLTEKVPGRKLNRILRPKQSEFDFNKNPGQSVVKEGITANTRGELLSKITATKQEIGSQIDDILNTAANQTDDAAVGTINGVADTFKIGIGKTEPTKQALTSMVDDTVQQLNAYGFDDIAQRIKTIDINQIDDFDTLRNIMLDVAGGKKTIDVSTAIIEPINKAKEVARRTGDKAFFSRLDDLQEGLTKEFDNTFNVVGDKNLSSLTPKEAQTLKIQIGKDTRWTGQAFDDDINKVRVAVYKAIDKLLDDAVPGIDTLNKRYAGMMTAEKALERANAVRERAVQLGLRSSIGGSAVGLYSGLTGDSPIEATIKGFLTTAGLTALGSTAVQTRFANILSKMTPDKQQEILNIFKNIYVGSEGQYNDTNDNSN